MVKWIALDPYKGLSESDTKFTSFEFCERNIIIFSKHIDLQSQAMYCTLTKTISKKMYIL